MDTTQGQPPPAYQEYASTMLANRQFRLMNATGRGVLYTMRLEIWVNKSLPSDPVALSKILGLDFDDVSNALPTVMPFFSSENGEIRCPELDGYRAYLERRRLAQSQGGKHTAATLNAKKEKSNRRKNRVEQGNPGDAANLPATLLATPPASLQPLSTAKQSKAQSNPPLEKDSISDDPWITDYTAAQVDRRAK